MVPLLAPWVIQLAVSIHLFLKFYAQEDAEEEQEQEELSEIDEEDGASRPSAEECSQDAAGYVVPEQNKDTFLTAYTSLCHIQTFEA